MPTFIALIALFVGLQQPALAPARTLRVYGKLIDGLGHRYPHIDWVWLVPRGASGDIYRTTPAFGNRKLQYVNKVGYEINDVRPGLYYLCSTRFDDITNRAETVIPIEVRDRDVEMDIVSDAGYVITGRIRFEDGRFPLHPALASKGETIPNLGIFIRSTDESIPLLVPNANIHVDGSFSFLPVPAGLFRLSIEGVPSPFYVKSVSRGVEDVLKKGFEVPSRNANSLVIVLTNR